MAAASVNCEVSIGERLKHKPLFKLGMQHLTSDSSTATRPRQDVFPLWEKKKKITLIFPSVNDLIIATERFASVAVRYKTLLAEYIKYPHLPNTPTDSEVTPVHASSPKRKLARFRSTFFRACVFEVSCTGPVMRVLSDEQLMVLIGVFSP